MNIRISVRLTLSIIVLTGIAQFGIAWGQVTRPLLQEGKTALYQRVIAIPGAKLNTVPGGSSATTLKVSPFSTFYVYQRSNNNGEWLQVGTDSTGTVTGWLPAEQAVDWNQTLTVAFRDSAGQNRVPLFGDRASLKSLIESGDSVAYSRLGEQAEQGISGDSPVVAIQPEGYIDIRKDFYLVPILDHEDVLVGGQQARLLHVATVPLQDSQAVVDTYRTGIVFVIDSTISMGPYIDKTREIMQRVYRSIEDANLADQVSYGLVAYRDNIATVPQLEFVTQTYASLADGTSGAEFLSRIAAVKPATVSSEGFNEDAYAGISEAINTIDWSGYYAKYIILISDAGPRVEDDPLSATGLGSAALRELARENDIAIGVFHLRTTAGASNHAFAEEQYRELSTISGIGDFYYPIKTGDVSGFETALSSMTEQLTAQVREAASGRPPTNVVTPSGDSPELDEFQNKVARLGYGLRMKYLQEEKLGGQRVPALFNAWMVDRDLAAPAERAIDVRVLLTRNQLSDLHEVLSQVLITAEEGTLAPDDFLDELKSLAATISRDPAAAKMSTRAVGGQSLADMGYMREYLEGLPYKSEVMNLDLSIWQQWPAQRQFEFISQLDGKVAYYRSLHDNVDLWVPLDEGEVDGDSVYPLLLEALP